MELRPQPRTIGVDTRNLALAHGTGVATYTATLLRSLGLIGLEAELLVAEPNRSRPRRWLAAALPGPVWSQPVPARDGLRARAAPDIFRTAQVHFDLWGRPLRLGGAGLPDVMHWTYPLPLRLDGRPNLYTVHDLIPLLQPEMTGIDATRSNRMLRRIAARAAHLVTVSEATRQDLIRCLGVPPERVTNTWQAVDVSGADPAPPAGLIRGAYWLHVGAVERRKNLRRLITAWQASGTPHPLVLAGPDGWNASEQMAAAVRFLLPLEKLSGAERPAILRLPWVPRAQLLALIRDAKGLLMPSLAEGFGLPVAEAMALGTPVLTSRSGALAEVAGGAAVLVEPTDEGAIAAGLRALDTDGELRARLVEAGLMRARLFTLDCYAERLRAVYRGLSAAGLLRHEIQPADTQLA